MSDVGREYVRALVHRTDRAIARARPLLREDTTLSMFTQIVEDVADLRDAPMIPLLDRLARVVALALTDITRQDRAHPERPVFRRLLLEIPDTVAALQRLEED